MCHLRSKTSLTPLIVYVDKPHQIQRGSGLCVRGHGALPTSRGTLQPPPGLLHQGMSPWLASPTWPPPPPDQRRLYLRGPWLNRPLHRPERDDPNAAMRSRYLRSNPRDPTASARASPRSRVVLQQCRQLRGVCEPLPNTSSCQRELRSGWKICRGQAGLGGAGGGVRHSGVQRRRPSSPHRAAPLHPAEFQRTRTRRWWRRWGSEDVVHGARRRQVTCLSL